MPFIGEPKDEALIKASMNFRQTGNLLHNQNNGYFDSLRRHIFDNPQKYSPQEVFNSFREDAADMLKWMQAHAEARTKYHDTLQAVAPAGYILTVKGNSVEVTGTPTQSEAAGMGVGQRLRVKPAKQPMTEEMLANLTPKTE